jgi:hypothetical protein
MDSHTPNLFWVYMRMIYTWEYNSLEISACGLFLPPVVWHLPRQWLQKQPSSRQPPHGDFLTPLNCTCHHCSVCNDSTPVVYSEEQFFKQYPSLFVGQIFISGDREGMIPIWRFFCMLQLHDTIVWGS